MSNFFRYFFQMPTLARFELETHECIEKGEALTADSMIDLDGRPVRGGLWSEGQDRPAACRHGMVHLFDIFSRTTTSTNMQPASRARMPYQARILRGEKNAVEDYLGFLRSAHPTMRWMCCRRAGVDLASPKPIEETFAVMEGYIDRLEKLLK